MFRGCVHGLIENTCKFTRCGRLVVQGEYVKGTRQLVMCGDVSGVDRRSTFTLRVPVSAS